MGLGVQAVFADSPYKRAGILLTFLSSLRAILPITVFLFLVLLVITGMEYLLWSLSLPLMARYVCTIVVKS